MAHSNSLVLVENGGWDERVLVCRNDDLVDVFIVVTERYVVLVDTVINAVTAEKMLDLARPFLENGRILLVINTHADYDHFWGNQLFAGPKALHPAPIIGPRGCLDVVNSPEQAQRLADEQKEEPQIFGEVRLVPPTLLFDGEMTIDGGDLTLRLIPTPGHVAEHISIYIPEIKLLLAADAAELPFPYARTLELLPAMRQSFETMLALEPEKVLYCHAPTDIGLQLIKDNKAYFDKLAEKCGEALANGVPAKLPEEADVAALLACRYKDAVPADDKWHTVHEYYQTKGHDYQLRMMLKSMAQALSA